MPVPLRGTSINEQQTREAFGALAADEIAFFKLTADRAISPLSASRLEVCYFAQQAAAC